MGGRLDIWLDAPVLRYVETGVEAPDTPATEPRRIQRRQRGTYGGAPTCSS